MRPATLGLSREFKREKDSYPYFFHVPGHASTGTAQRSVPSRPNSKQGMKGGGKKKSSRPSSVIRGASREEARSSSVVSHGSQSIDARSVKRMMGE